MTEKLNKKVRVHTTVTINLLLNDYQVCKLEVKVRKTVPRKQLKFSNIVTAP